MLAIPNSSIPNTTCGHPRSDSFVLLRNAVDSDMPWPGFVFGVTASSIWYWCADQVNFVLYYSIVLCRHVKTISESCSLLCIIFYSTPPQGIHC